MYRKVHLHGSLGERFGKVHRLDVNSPAQATKALCQHPGFREHIREGRFHVVSGKGPDSGVYYDEDSLHFGLGDNDLHLVPVVEGSGGKAAPWAYVVIGLALITAAFVAGPIGFMTVLGKGIGMFAFNATIAIGASMLLTGTTQLLAKTANAPGGTTDEAKRKDNLIFGSSGEQVVQGRCVPIVIGRTRVKLIPISVGLFSEEG